MIILFIFAPCFTNLIAFMVNLIDSNFEILILDFISSLYCGELRIQDVVSELYSSYPHSLAHVLCKSVIDYLYDSAF